MASLMDILHAQKKNLADLEDAQDLFQAAFARSLRLHASVKKLQLEQEQLFDEATKTFQAVGKQADNRDSEEPEARPLPVPSHKRRLKALGKAQVVVLNLFLSGPLARKEVVALSHNENGYAVVKGLVSRGLLEQKEGDLYGLTEAGRAATTNGSQHHVPVPTP